MSQEGALFWAGIGIEIIAVGLGVTGVLTATQGWIIAGLGLLFFVPIIIYYWTFREKPTLPPPVQSHQSDNGGDKTVRFPSASSEEERGFLIGYQEETQRREGMKPSQVACPFCGEYAWYLKSSERVLTGGLDPRPPYSLEVWECNRCGRSRQTTS